MQQNSPIIVKLQRSGDTVSLESDEGSLQATSSHVDKLAYPDTADFAAWFFLPVAMRTGRPLHIEGVGSSLAVRNASTMSTIWSMWLPGHFHPVTLSFAKEVNQESSTAKGDLCLFSGGVDSTYSILKRHLQGEAQDLLTVHGMDYKADDRERFADFMNHTNPFAELVANTRIIVKMNAYSLYKKHNVNPDKHHVGHIFALAGSAFLHAKDYARIRIAADYRLDQQFMVYPWGSNSATNRFFNNGVTSLQTDSDDVTRSEKMQMLSSHETAVRSLSFCVDYKSRPYNCGECSKCTRTKLMFLASAGQMPPIFRNNGIPENWIRSFKYEKPSELAFALDTIMSAKHNGHYSLFPNFEQNESVIMDFLNQKSNNSAAYASGKSNTLRDRLFKSGKALFRGIRGK